MWLGNESISSLRWLKWLNQKEIDRFEVNWIGKNGPIGYILEADLEYPDKLHKLHNDYLLAPKNLKLVMTCCQIIVVILEINMG